MKNTTWIFLSRPTSFSDSKCWHRKYLGNSKRFSGFPGLPLGNKLLNYVCNLRTNPFLLLFILVCGIGFANCKPAVSEDARTEATYRESLSIAESNGRKVLIVLGADWCADCRSLKERFLGNPEIRNLLLERYLVLHVDVGRFDRNTGFTEQFGSPEKKGIPALVVVDPKVDGGRILATTQGGEFSSARSMSDEAIFQYLVGF